MSVNTRLLGIVIEYITNDLNKVIERIRKIRDEAIVCYNSCATSDDYELKWDIRSDLTEIVDDLVDVLKKLRAIIGD